MDAFSRQSRETRFIPAVKLLGILQRGAPGGQICDDFITSQAAAAGMARITFWSC